MLPIEQYRAEYRAYQIAAEEAGMSRPEFAEHVNRFVLMFGSKRPADYVNGARFALEKVRPGPKLFTGEPSPCCPLAERTPCVCLVSWKCPFHGDTHHGTHE